MSKLDGNQAPRSLSRKRVTRAATRYLLILSSSSETNHMHCSRGKAVTSDMLLKSH